MTPVANLALLTVSPYRSAPPRPRGRTRPPPFNTKCPVIHTLKTMHQKTERAPAYVLIQEETFAARRVRCSKQCVGAGVGSENTDSNSAACYFIALCLIRYICGSVKKPIPVRRFKSLNSSSDSV